MKTERVKIGSASQEKRDNMWNELYLKKIRILSQKDV